MLIDAVVENFYTGPAREMLEHLVTGYFKITAMEIQSAYESSQDAFTVILQARFVDTLRLMADEMRGRDRVKDYNHERGNYASQGNF